MMKYYLDITLLPDTEDSLGFIWQKVYQQIHIALAENKLVNGNSAIAVSFPEYSNGIFPMGNKLRLFSPTQELLQQLDVAKWLSRLTDYTHCTSIKDVPEVNEFACFYRRQFATNVARLARRRAKRKGESLEQAMQYYSDFNDKSSTLPFINMVSLSTKEGVSFADKNQFRLFVEKRIVEQPCEGEFSCYGLSKTATVPWF